MNTEELRAWVWERHANPKSGWSRVAVLPVLLYAVFRRKPRLALAAIVFAVLNPVLFSPPEDEEAWMTRVVLAERWWVEEERAGLLDLSYPNVLNLCNVPATLCAFVAAYRKAPRKAALAGALSMALKFWYVGELVRRYDARAE